MLEPDYNQGGGLEPNAFNPFGDQKGESTEFTRKNRSDLSTAGGWTLFLGIFFGLMSLFSLYGLVLSFNAYNAGLAVLYAVIGLAFYGSLTYWYIQYYVNAKAIGDGSNYPMHSQKMTSALLAIFRIWGVFMIIVLVIYLIGLLALFGRGF